MPNLVIFDIDGTLVNSYKVDENCFIDSIKEEFGIDSINSRWENYRTTTDNGIFEEIFENSFNRKPSDIEIRRHISKFLYLLKKCAGQDIHLFEQILGANESLNYLKNSKNWCVTIATGGWKDTAVFKLDISGLEYADIPLLTSSDAKIREEIILKSIEYSKEHYNVDKFEKVVSVGDGIWDLKAANVLGIGFIGVGKTLKRNFDVAAVEDYADREKFFDLLYNAKIPNSI